MGNCFNTTERIARKQHRCGECHKVIEIKEIYTYESGIYDDTPFHFKTCNNCVSMRFLVSRECVLGELLEDVRWYVDEVNGKIPEDVLSKLTPQAKVTILSMTEKYK